MKEAEFERNKKEQEVQQLKDELIRKKREDAMRIRDEIARAEREENELEQQITKENNDLEVLTLQVQDEMHTVFNLSMLRTEYEQQLDEIAQAKGLKTSEHQRYSSQKYVEQMYVDDLDLRLHPFASVSNFKGVKNIIVIGETGAGKSTFINIATNFFTSGTLDNMQFSIPTRFHQPNTSGDGPFSTYCGVPSTERNIHNPSESQTDACSNYVFRNQETAITFIDTPGLGQ